MTARLAAVLLWLALSMLSASASAEDDLETFSIMAGPESQEAPSLQPGDLADLFVHDIIWASPVVLDARVEDISWTNGKKVLTFALTRLEATMLGYALKRGKILLERSPGTLRDRPDFSALLEEQRPKRFMGAPLINPVIHREVPLKGSQ
ncbi:MAG: hypothetical protein AAGC81_02110 [Pseudomonadota bacterium]